MIFPATRGKEDFGGLANLANKDEGVVWLNGWRTVAANEDSGKFITSWAHRYGMSTETAMAALSEAQEHWILGDGSEQHGAAIQAQRFYRNLMMLVMAYKGPSRFALDCACLA